MHQILDKDKKAIIGLSFFEGIGPVRYKVLVDYFGSAYSVYTASEHDLIEAGFTRQFINKFASFRNKTDLDNIARELSSKKIYVITKTDKYYPELLRSCPGAPFILYALGNTKLLSETFPIAIVGTRKPTRYGIQVTRMLTNELVRAGCTIVSGMAMGIDAIAHKTALENKGKTIAVLGCGVDICYPAVNHAVYKELIGNGLIISEFPPGMRTSRGVFPSRNRIIAGLSLGVLVTEGARKSGSLITASRAAEYGRDVYAIPGSITNEMSKACNFLIKSGAQLIESGSEILDEYQKHTQAVSKENMLDQIKSLSIQQKQIVDIIVKHDSVHIDTLSRIVSIDTKELLPIISELELSRIITEIENGIYTLNSHL